MDPDYDVSFKKSIVRFLKVAYETWKFYIDLILFLFTLGLTGGLGGILIDSASLVVIGFATATITGVVFIVISTYANRHPRYEVKVLKKYVTYRYFPDCKTMEHTKSYTIVSLINNLKSFWDRYKWSCTHSAKCDVALLTPHQILVPKKDAEWNINEIVFDPPLHKAQIVEIALRWDLYCDGEAVPFLSQIIDHPTEYLELSVFVPYKPKDIEFIHFNSGEGIVTDPNSIVGRKPGIFYPATGQMRYVIEKPKFKNKYMIRWTPPDQ